MSRPFIVISILLFYFPAVVYSLASISLHDKHCKEAYPILSDEALISSLQEEKRRGIALDIDETISWTIGAWLEILLQKFGNPENLSVEDMANKYHLAQNVPYWKDNPGVQEWMKQTRTDNNMQKNLPLITNALETIKEIHKDIPILAYITVRPQAVLSGNMKNADIVFSH
jgi:hypothetical protein